VRRGTDYRHGVIEEDRLYQGRRGPSLIDDPAFARRLSRPVHRWTTTWQRAAPPLSPSLRALATIVGVLSDAVSLVLSSTALTTAAVWVFYRVRHARR
jgi:hypothetical protein